MAPRRRVAVVAAIKGNRIRLSRLLVRLLRRVASFLKISALRRRNARPEERASGFGRGSPLHALTAAAMALPGMAHAVEPQDAQIGYSSYQEGDRDVWTGPKGNIKVFDPIHVDSLHAGTGIKLSDNTRLDLNYLQDTWSGATPILAAPEGFMTVSGASPYPSGTALVNKALVPYGIDTSGHRVQQPRLVDMMTSASAETRKEGRFRIVHASERSELGIGGGVSDEHDFLSRFMNVSGRWDLNQKRTTLDGGLSLTRSRIDADIGAPSDWNDYGLYKNATSGPTVTEEQQNGNAIQKFIGERHGWSANLGLTQVLNKNTTFSTGLSYVRDSGFLEEPYKLVLMAFADPNTPPPLFSGLLLTRMYSVAESRPDVHNRWAWNSSLAHYFAGPDAALQLDYRYARDDWGVASHTLETQWRQAAGEGWTVTPRLRYYTQSAADFYQPYFIFAQKAPTHADGTLDFSQVPVTYYSSDYRLSAYGAVSGGLSVSKQFDRGLSLEVGVERYVHAAHLKLGGGEADSFSDFGYWLFNLGLKLDFDAMATSVGAGSMDDMEGMDHMDHMRHMDHAGHMGHAGHAGTLAPAGVMNAHMMSEPGSMMLGYHFMVNRQSGEMRHGTQAATDADITALGCGTEECTLTPRRMDMRMHMLDLMYAPTDWLNLMAMFQLMDMDMKMRPLEDSVTSSGGVHNHAGHPEHTTGGVGDTTVSALMKLFDAPGHELHLGLGLSIPTGAVDIKESDGTNFMHYGMQLGSGTWDLLPSLTYNGSHACWFWGAQVSGVKRTGGVNDSGYALGDVFQTTAWGGYQLTDWLAATVRPSHTTQGAIKGHFNGPQVIHGPMDLPESYGGSYWEMGLGLSAAAPGRMAQGDRIQIEAQKSFDDDVNGYQLERGTSLTFSWTMMF